MKVMVCIPMEIDIDTYGRKENKEAVRAKLMAQGLDILKPNLTAGFFLVRKPERVPGFGADGKPEAE